jgi:DNA-binding NarL/FixJ family response regulator
MGRDEVIVYGLASTKPPAQPAPGTADSVGPLSRREREVVVLIAQGYSNRDISEALVIAERTAEVHVSHVFNKLGVRSRAQVAARAVEHGLTGTRPADRSASSQHRSPLPPELTDR